MNAYTTAVASASESVSVATGAQPGMDTLELFDTVLPSQGLRCIAVPNDKGGFRHDFFADNAQAARAAHQLDAAGNNVFFALAGFTNQALDKERNEKGKLIRGGRKQANVGWLKAFWADLDCGEGKPYATAREALISLKAFLDLTALPKPWIVASGRGLHVYWPLEEEIERADWKPVAEKLKAAFHIAKLHADPSRTSDEASVLRPVGCHHRKAEPKPVVLLKSGEIWPFETFRDQVQEFLDANPSAPLPTTKKSGGLNAELWGGIEYPPTYADKIADRCAVMGLVRDTQGNVDQPTWFRALGIIAFCEDGDQVAQDWSCGHPDYDPDEVAEKLEQVRQFKPTTCAKLAECQPDLCAGCPFNGKLVSPIRLGMVVPVATQEAVAQADARIQAVAVAQGHRIPSLKEVNDEAEGIAILNRKYAFVHDWGGQSGYVRFTPDGGIVWTTDAEIRAGEDNKSLLVSGGEGSYKRKPAGSWWLRHFQRAEYDRVDYDPELAHIRPGERVLNLWRGFALQGRPGEWGRMRRHLLEVVCRGDSAAFQYLLCWLAHLVQHPGEAPGSVIVLKSTTEGTGKSTVGNWFHRIVGRAHSLLLNSPEQILGQFNDHLEAKSLLVVNEPSFPGDHAGSRRFKSIITESELLIHPKFRRPYLVRNTLHILLTTNEAWAVPAGNKARRYLVLEVDDRFANDPVYFGPLYAEADNGGLEAMLYFLQRLDISGWRPQEIPITDALIDQQERSLPIEAEWALSMTADMFGGWFGGAVTTNDLYRALVDYAKDCGRRPPANTVFGRWLSSLGLQEAKVGPRRSRGWLLPAEDEFHALVRRAAGIHQRREDR
ncbi:MAG: hypothetical protein IRY87_16210 [Acetobacteraceae bacterium]|nr:hypothetical protein [Acetobacteraceae bacterium]